MYFVGINIGINKTIVSRSPGYNGASVSQMRLGECMIVDTAINRYGGEWHLGDIDGFMLGNVRSRSGFRGPIIKLSNHDREALREFVKLIFHNILKYDTDLRYISLDDKNFELSIACPFDWVREDPSAQQEYLDFFRKECGVPVDFYMRENDATYYSRCERFNEDESVFVIDIGASVIDFSTYVESKSIGECSWGINLGTHHIVDCLLAHIISDGNNAKNLQKLKEFRNSMGLDNDVLAQLRLYIQNKVEYYFTERWYEFTLYLKYQDLTPKWPGKPWDLCIKFQASREEFNEIISGYTSAVKDAFVNTKIRLNQCGITPNRILLSGSASRMPFIRQYSELVFGVKVDVEPMPEFSISNGIALYMYRTDHLLEKFLVELKTGLIGITILNIDYKKIDMAIGHALHRSLAYDIDSSSIDSKRNVNISSHLFLSNKDVNSILEERIMKYAIKVFREYMYFDVKY